MPVVKIGLKQQVTTPKEIFDCYVLHSVVAFILLRNIETFPEFA